MRCGTLFALTLAGAAIAAPARLTAQASPLSGHWRIDFSTDSSSKRAPLTARGALQLRDTLVVGRNEPKERAHPALVGECYVFLQPLGADPIGREVHGGMGPTGEFFARLGEGYDRGEIELHGRIEGDTVVGYWLIVWGEMATRRGGTFIMRR